MYRWPSTSVIVAPLASFAKMGNGPGHPSIQFIGTPPIIAARACSNILFETGWSHTNRFSSRS